MKVAIITGSSRGLGFSLCESLKGLGYRVFGLSRSNIAPEGCEAMKLDLGLTETLCSQMDKLWSSLDDQLLEEVVLVHNGAKLGPIAPLGKIEPSELETHLKINIVAPMMINNWFVKVTSGLKLRRVIVGISSGAARNGYAGWSAYCSSKAANLMMSQCLAKEEDSLEAWDYNPGVMETQMQEEIRKSSKENFPSIEKFINLHKSGGLKSTREVAEHLASLIIKKQESGALLSWS